MKIICSKEFKTGLVVVACLLALGFTLPQVLTLHYQSRAGSLMEEFIQREASDYQDHFACLLPILVDYSEVNTDEISQAISLLQRSSRLTPNNTHTMYMLGKAYCMVEDYQSASETLSDYKEARPNDPLGKMELGFAYFTWAQTLGDEQEEAKTAYMDRSVTAFEDAGLRGGLFRGHGDIVYERADFRTACVYYEIAGVDTDLAPIRKAVLSFVKINGEDCFCTFMDDSNIDIIDDELIIPPGEFVRLNDGTPVSVRSRAEKRVGVYFSNYDIGGKFIEVVNSGYYSFIIQALDASPAPTKIEFSIDLQPFSILKLENGDEKMEYVELECFLKRGTHLLSFRLINDANVDKLDRNGYLGELTIRCSNEK